MLLHEKISVNSFTLREDIPPAFHVIAGNLVLGQCTELELLDYKNYELYLVIRGS
jgi:hypothetical protein